MAKSLERDAADLIRAELAALAKNPDMLITDQVQHLARAIELLLKVIER